MKFPRSLTALASSPFFALVFTLVFTLGLLPSGLAQASDTSPWIEFNGQTGVAAGVEINDFGGRLILELRSEGTTLGLTGDSVRYLRAKTRIGVNAANPSELQFVDIQFEPIDFVGSGVSQGDAYEYAIKALPMEVKRDVQLSIDKSVAIRAIGFEMKAQRLEGLPSGFLPNFIEFAINAIGYRIGQGVTGMKFSGMEVGSYDAKFGYAWNPSETTSIRFTLAGVHTEYDTYKNVPGHTDVWLYHMADVFSRIDVKFENGEMDTHVFLQGGFRDAGNSDPDHPGYLKYNYLQLGVSVSL